MKMRHMLQWLCIIISIAVGVAGCKTVEITEQRSTATAYQKNSMLAAKGAAEAGALAFCNINFEGGLEAYKQSICSVTTSLGCEHYTQELDKSWDSIVDVYNTDALVCDFVSSELMEESTQFGFPVQVWFVRLIGTVGWPENQTNRDYWLQIAEESGEWKLNRMLSLTEIEYFQSRFQGSTNAQ